MTNDEVLRLLELMDEGYVPSEQERKALAEVRQLDLSNKGLTILPGSISILTKLTRLDLSYNQLIKLPDSISSLIGLSSLNLSHNQLIKLADSIRNLIGLSSLNLSYNHLFELPDGISSLTKLSEINLSYNRMKILPTCVSKLSELTSLNISYNPIKTLPEWLGNFNQLTSCELRGLTLDRLPESLLHLNIPYYLTNNSSPWGVSQGIYLSDTTLTLQPVSVFDQSNDLSPRCSASRKLIEDFFHAKPFPLREAKIILLGNPWAGKTYTVQRLKNDCQKGNYKTEETHGILINDLHPVRNGIEYTVRIWDFGGQDIMNPIHRCFLTERTCYVIMVDTRHVGQTQQARHWLRTVRSVDAKAPILLLINEYNEGQNLDLDAVSLQQEFPNLHGVKYCSARDAGQEVFRENFEKPIIELALGMDSCKITMPESWEEVRHELLSMRENNFYIDRRQFHRICDEHGVPNDDQLRVWLLNWFNDMGVCFSYHVEVGKERDTDYKILEPKWLTSAIYRLMWCERQNDYGIITRDRIEDILAKEGSEDDIQNGIPCLPGVKYKTYECGYVLEIMRMFHISYSINEQEEFLPTLCKPDSRLNPAPTHYLENVSFQFRYDLLPENVIHELMIYCYCYLSRARLWRRGFWLENVKLGYSAVVYTPENERTTDILQIDVYRTDESTNVGYWLQSLCKEVRKINVSCNLKATEWVLACGEKEEQWFKVDTIWNWRKKNRNALMGEDEEYLIHPLLELVYGSYLTAAERDHDISKDDRHSPNYTQKMSELEQQVLTIKDAIAKMTVAIEKQTIATNENTDATKRNTR